MKTKKLTPRNVAPVQREINATSSASNVGIAPLIEGESDWVNKFLQEYGMSPFRGDDAE